jgi:hypothetical protein
VQGFHAYIHTVFHSTVLYQTECIFVEYKKAGYDHKIGIFWSVEGFGHHAGLSDEEVLLLMMMALL